MIIVDTALEQRAAEGNPVRVGIIGAGYMGRGVVLQIVTGLPGMVVAAVSNRTIDQAERAFRDAGIDDARQVSSTRELDTCIAEGKSAFTANATGFKVAKRGMHGPTCQHVTEAPGLFPLEMFEHGGLVDYVLGAEPGPGVFVLGYNDHPIKRQYMNYFKMGEGPVYTFYVPYHLPHLEAPLTAARAVLFGDCALKPLARRSAT